MHKILVIDDDVDLTKVLHKILRSHGFEVIVANDSVQGIQYAHEEQPDLILLDLKLPGGGGLMTLRRIKMSSHTNWMSVIVMTCVNDIELREAVYKEGVDGYIKKPYETHELITKIKTILGKDTGEDS